MIYSTAYRIIKNHHIAEEIEQDALLKIVNNIDKIIDINSKKSRNYIITLTKNTAINVYNKEKHSCETIDENLVNYNEELFTPDILDYVITTEGYNHLLNILEQMEDTYKETLKLKLLYEYSNDEIAQIQGISKRAVEMRVFRGRTIIKEILQKEHDGYVVK